MTRILRSNDTDENGINCRKFMESLSISFFIGLLSGITTAGISFTFSEVVTVYISDEFSNLFDIGDIICDFVNSAYSSATSDIIAMVVDEESVSGKDFALNIMKEAAKCMAITREINFCFDMHARQNDRNQLCMEWQNGIIQFFTIIFALFGGTSQPEIYNSNDACNR